VTVSLELSGPEASRPFIEAARPEHPSLLDPGHRMDALFGVVNIPNVVWIDEDGMIVRPAEPGWPGGRQEFPTHLFADLPKMGRAPQAPPPREGAGQRSQLTSGQDRERYVDALRDWVAKGPDSEYALSPSEVVERSQPRPLTKSEAAAHFELANHFWRAGQRDRAVEHFNACIRLQPENWTYKRQAWSLWGHERVGGEVGRFVQAPVEGEEDDWPFESDFSSDVAALSEGAYYPRSTDLR
jgi:hypothetical protein